jgi:hypothetical protein
MRRLKGVYQGEKPDQGFGEAVGSGRPPELKPERISSDGAVGTGDPPKGGSPEEEIARWLIRVGQALPEASLPLSPEAGARAWRAIREALERSAARPSLREQLREWGARLRALGALAFSPPPHSAALAAAGPEGPSEALHIASIRSDDLRLTATLVITRFGEVWVGFETEDPELAGRAVRFELRAPEAPEPLAEGTVPLEPAGAGGYEARCRLGTLEDLGASGPFELRFAVVEEA